MAITNATFSELENGTHPLRADQTRVDQFKSRCRVTRGPASPTAKHYHHHRPSRTLPTTASPLFKNGSALVRNIQLP